MSFYGWKPYIPAAERRKKTDKAIAKAIKAGADLAPIAAYRGAIAKTFWGKAWCDNLERYSDYSNRLPRGRTYVRNGSVIDLKITHGNVQAQVMGSNLYQITVSVTAVAKTQWHAISTDCAGSIDSLVELLQGRLSKAVMRRICMPTTGLFPAAKDIQFSCSCPDWAAMCKHVAAVLYGVGARLDTQPELIFTLRGVNAQDLVTQAGAGLPSAKQRPATGKVLDNTLLADVFGIEMADVAPTTTTAARQTPTTTKPTAATKPKTPAVKSPKVISKSKAKKKIPIQVPALTSVGRGKSAVRKVTATDAIIEMVKPRRKSTAKTKQRDSG
jgi:uncharacterized Zn finger protein